MRTKVRTLPLPRNVQFATNHFQIGTDIAHADPDHSPMTQHFSERITDHDHHTGPEKPVSRAGNVPRLVHAGERQECHHVSPPLVAGTRRSSLAYSIVNCQGSNDAPREERPEEVGDADVEANEESGSDESWCPFDVPAPVLNVDSPVVVIPPDKEPLLSSTWCVLSFEDLTYQVNICQSHSSPIA